jgi:ABC-type nitrate/sulfonate/bicarbonate transport system substrate-binding protein
LSERPDEVKRVLRAMLKANGYILKNREGTIQVLVHWAKSRPEFAEAGYDSAVNVFSMDGSIPEDGMRVVLDGYRKSMNIARQIPLSEVADLAPLLEAQRELGLRK